MISLDTNVVVRFLVQDDPGQARKVRRLLEDSSERGEPCLLTDTVLCETEWVLESAYGATRPDVTLAFQRLLGSKSFEFEDRRAVGLALDAYQSGRGDLSDHLIGVRAVSRGASTTYTFDKALGGRPEFTLL